MIQPTLYPQLAALRRRTTAEPVPAAMPFMPSLRQDAEPLGGFDYAPGGFNDPLMFLAMTGGPDAGFMPPGGGSTAGGFTVGTSTGATNGYRGGGGFTPTGDPGSATEYGSPDRLITKAGITGVPAAVRSLLRGGRRTGIDPQAISEAVLGEGFRTRDEQAAAYQRYLSGQGALAAPPGHSMHEVGRAFDITTSWLDQHPEYRQWLLDHGWEFPVTGEPWHAEWQGPETLPRPAASSPPPSPSSSRSPSPSPSRKSSSRRTQKPPTYREVMAEKMR